MIFYLIVLITASIAGFFTGLLGIGGGLIIYPCFLFLLPALGFKTLDINLISGIAATQVLMGSLFAFFSHKKDHLLDKKYLFQLAIFAGLGAITGGVTSVLLNQKTLLLMYLAVLLFALFSIFFIKESDQTSSNESSSPLAYALYFASGSMAGALGLGGAVLYIPILRHYFKISTKACICNVTLFVFVTAVMTFIGKTATGQIPYDLVIYTILGSFAGAKVGSTISQKLKSETLRKILLIIIILTAIRVLISILAN